MGDGAGTHLRSDLAIQSAGRTAYRWTRRSVPGLAQWAGSASDRLPVCSGSGRWAPLGFDRRQRRGSAQSLPVDTRAVSPDRGAPLDAPRGDRRDPGVGASDGRKAEESTKVVTGYRGRRPGPHRRVRRLLPAIRAGHSSQLPLSDSRRSQRSRLRGCVDEAPDPGWRRMVRSHLQLQRPSGLVAVRYLRRHPRVESAATPASRMDVPTVNRRPAI
jgi:hypothetical protein